MDGRTHYDSPRWLWTTHIKMAQPNQPKRQMKRDPRTFVRHQVPNRVHVRRTSWHKSYNHTQYQDSGLKHTTSALGPISCCTEGPCVWKTKITEMFEDNIGEPAQTECAFSIEFASKNDGNLKLCVDYRRLIALPERDLYLIFQMDRNIDSLGETTSFSALCGNSGYSHTKIEEQCRHKTAFAFHHGLCHYKRMFYELQSAPCAFQITIEVILATEK